jgi:hypothetical protein
VVPGTSAASPSPPALPAHSLELAQVSVAAAAGSVTAGSITDRRVPGGTWAAPRGTVFRYSSGSNKQATAATPTVDLVNVTVPTVPGRLYAPQITTLMENAAGTNGGINWWWAGAQKTGLADTRLVGASQPPSFFQAVNARHTSVTATAATTAFRVALQQAGGPGAITLYSSYSGIVVELYDVGGGVI